ncbi:MAG: hypothetical protein RRZ68_04530 [Oscillospiraceae bacterium]
MAVNKKKRVHKWAFPLGLLMAILAAIGVVTIIVAGINVGGKIIYNSKKYDDYNKMLVPVVMNDPGTFDDLKKANQSQLIDISIWSILKSDLTPDKYEYGEGGVLIPEADVTESFKKLFGTENLPVHATVEGYGYEFTYDATKKIYTIPLTGIVPTYTPKVVKTEKKSGSKILTVAYLAGDQWAQDAQGNMIAPQPDKFMKITLRKSDTGYYISAIQATSNPETATTIAPTQNANNLQTTAPSTAGALEQTSTSAPVAVVS